MQAQNSYYQCISVAISVNLFSSASITIFPIYILSITCADITTPAVILQVMRCIITPNRTTIRIIIPMAVSNTSYILFTSASAIALTFTSAITATGSATCAPPTVSTRITTCVAICYAVITAVVAAVSTIVPAKISAHNPIPSRSESAPA